MEDSNKTKDKEQKKNHHAHQEKHPQDPEAGKECAAGERDAASGAEIPVKEGEPAAEAEGAENDSSLSNEERLSAELSEARDKYLRLAAEFDNYRRRVAKEKLELVSSAGEEVIKGLLPVLDDCERALEVLRKSEDVAAAKEGTELIYNKLISYLKSKGVAVVEARGKELDTDFHEAVAQFPVEEKEKKGKIIDVVQQGYTLNGKVIRFAKVVVGV